MLGLKAREQVVLGVQGLLIGFRFWCFPDPREDLKSRSPNLGPYTTKGTLKEPPLRDLLFGSSRGSGLGIRRFCVRGLHTDTVSGFRCGYWFGPT